MSGAGGGPAGAGILFEMMKMNVERYETSRRSIHRVSEAGRGLFPPCKPAVPACIPPNHPHTCSLVRLNDPILRPRFNKLP